MSEIVENPFGAPKKAKDNSQNIKRFLRVVEKEMGLYTSYNSDTLVKAYRYCKRELGDDFEDYLKCIRAYITLQDADYKQGKVAIHFLTDAFLKFPQVIAQLKKEGKWHAEFPNGWSVDSTGAPIHPEYQLISRGLDGYMYAGKKDYLVPLVVVYNRDKRKFIKISNAETGEIIWEAK